MTYTGIIQQRKDCWIGWIKEVPGVNCQEKTREELIDTLRITLVEILELNHTIIEEIQFKYETIQTNTSSASA